MKNIIPFIALIFIFVSCKESAEYRQRCDIITPQTIYLNNPEFNDLLTPGNTATANGGPRGLALYNAGTHFVALSRECPNDTDCSQPMTIENSLFLVCPCDESKYSILDGSPQTEGVTQSVCEFKVSQGKDVLNISNY